MTLSANERKNGGTGASSLYYLVASTVQRQGSFMPLRIIRQLGLAVLVYIWAGCPNENRLMNLKRAILMARLFYETQ